MHRHVETKRLFELQIDHGIGDQIELCTPSRPHRLSSSTVWFDLQRRSSQISRVNIDDSLSNLNSQVYNISLFLARRLSPIVNQQTCSLNNVLNDSDDFAETSAAVFSVHESLPFNTLPLLATANSLQYRNHLSLFIRQCNKVYQEFLQSIGGFNADGSCAFNGQVVIVGDSLGSILAYDALTQINVAVSVLFRLTSS